MRNETSKPAHRYISRLLSTALLFAPLGAFAQQPPAAQSAPPPATATASSAGGGDAEELAKKLSNPVASLISVPFQFNYDGSIGPEDNGDKYQLNVQPVIPVSISENWNMIARIITPIIYQKNVVPDEEQFGLGDINPSLFFSPKAPTKRGGIIWGVGPVALLPTATDRPLGTGKFGLGPTALVLKQSKGWTYGMLANHIWSIAGDDDRADVSSTFMQPFVSYTNKKAWTFGLNAESSYDWNSDKWSIPVNGTVSKLIKIGKQPISIGGGVRYWADSPEGGPEGFGARLIITFLFPEKK